jgi:hypothetical protein
MSSRAARTKYKLNSKGKNRKEKKRQNKVERFELASLCSKSLDCSRIGRFESEQEKKALRMHVQERILLNPPLQSRIFIKARR